MPRGYVANPTGKTGRTPGKANFEKTLETYNRVADAYREAPGNHTRASKKTGMTTIACRTLWQKGWPKFPWARPIQRIVGEEYSRWRAEGLERDRRMKEVADADLERRRAELRESLIEEGQIAASVRQSVLAAALVSRRLVPSMDALAQLVRNEVLIPDPTDPSGKRTILNPACKISAPMAVSILGRWALMVQRLSESEKNVIFLGDEDRKKMPIGEAEAAKPTPDQVMDALNLNADLRDLLVERARLRAERSDSPEGAGAQETDEDEEPSH